MTADLSRIKFCVPEHGLDVADVGTVFQHESGHGVSKKMTRTSLAGFGFGHVVVHFPRIRVLPEKVARLDFLGNQVDGYESSQSGTTKCLHYETLGTGDYEQCPKYQSFMLGSTTTRVFRRCV